MARKVVVSIVPGKSVTVEVDENGTVADALAAASVSPEGYQVRAGGSVLNDLNAPVEDGDNLVVTRQVKGN